MKGAVEKSSSVTPALLSTENDDGTFVLVELRIRWELGPVVSVWLPARGRTAQNLAVRPDVVFNLPPDGTGTDEGAGAMPSAKDATVDGAVRVGAAAPTGALSGAVGGAAGR